MAERLDHPAGISMRMRIPVHEVGGESLANAWSCDGTRLATVSDSGCDMWVIDFDAWKFHHAFSTDRSAEGGSASVVWSPVDPDIFVQACGDTMTLLCVDSGSRTYSPLWQSRCGSHVGWRPALSFSPTGNQIAVAYGGPDINIVDAASGTNVSTLRVGSFVKAVRWLSDRRQISVLTDSAQLVNFYSSDDSTVYDLIGQQEAANWATWSPSGQLLCATDADYAVRVWDSVGRPVAVLEGHTGKVFCVDFSYDCRLLYSVARDRTLRCWRTDTWQCVGIIDIDDRHGFCGGLAASPTRAVLARRTSSLNDVEVFEIDIDRLLVGTTSPSTHTYANAKVVLVGDTGVGKSGLALVLSNQPYQATESTHARQVWTFDVSQVEVPGGGTETREILLWDLAGQPGYRLIHQLHLGEVTVALLVFDSRSESDPFAGVRYWMRALRLYTSANHASVTSVPVILVAARVDRGGIPVSRQRIAALCDELGVMAYLETSAKEGRGIAELAETIRRAVDWAMLPRFVSTELFNAMKRFLIDSNEVNRVLVSLEDLLRLFVRRHPEYVLDDELQEKFEVCVLLLEGRDLVRLLSSGRFALLRPELLDAYASALIDAARSQPDGLGCVSEHDALAGRFSIPQDIRLSAPEDQLLLMATVEELQRHDLVLRELTDGGVNLVFPSQFTHERLDVPLMPQIGVIYRFDGAVATVYAKLVVRLSREGAYQRVEMWRNASTYRAPVGGVCGLRLREVDGRGELTLFFDEAASEETRYAFEEYVHAHLEVNTLPGSVLRERVFICARCGYQLPADLVRRRHDRGDTSMQCPACEQEKISLLDQEFRLGSVSLQSTEADVYASHNRATSTIIIGSKDAAGKYDVFLSYNSEDRAVVAEIAGRLRDEGVQPWFAKNDIPGGARWYEELEQRIKTAGAGAVLVGPNGFGRWQNLEQQAFVEEYARRAFRVIPVVLAGTEGDPELPVFLGQFQKIDLRVHSFDQLLQAIREPRLGR